MNTRLAIILARLLLAGPLFVLFLVWGEQTPEMLSFVAAAFRKHPLL